MIYSEREKQRIDNILAAFHTYIQSNPTFDIAYSEKVGYLWLQVNCFEETEPVVLHSVNELLKALFYEIICDEIYDARKINSEVHRLTPARKQKVQLKIMDILMKMDSDASYCMDYLDAYMKGPSYNFGFDD